LSPQHRTPPPAVAAQECPKPPAIATKLSLDGFTTSVGSVCDTVLLIPSWPKRLPPQHHAVPSARRAQLCVFPPAMATTLSKPTIVGRVWVARVPSPSRPLPLKPQQNGTPTATRAHVWNSPTAMEMALVRPLTAVPEGVNDTVRS